MNGKISTTISKITEQLFLKSIKDRTLYCIWNITRETRVGFDLDYMQKQIFEVIITGKFYKSLTLFKNTPYTPKYK